MNRLRYQNMSFAFDRPDEECTRCGLPNTSQYKVHSRLYGYLCLCGNQEWKPVKRTEPSHPDDIKP